MEVEITERGAPPSYFESITGTQLVSEDPFRGSTSSDRTSGAFYYDAVTLRRNSEALTQPTPGQRLTFYDFLPSCHTSSSTTQDTFSSLLARVNGWLSTNPLWRVRKCETIKVWVDSKTNEYLTDVYYDDEKSDSLWVLGIRIWLTTPEHEYGVSLVQPQLGVIHLVARSAPYINSAGKPSVAFENVQQLLERFKKMWEQKPLPGRFLSVDTRKTPLQNLQSFDPERLVYRREKHYTPSTLEVIRIFYELGSPENENIEIIDILPVTTIPMLGSVQREPFQDLFNTTRTWLKKHCLDPGHRILNIQTLELDVRPGGQTDTSRLWTTAEAKKEFYVRFLRASFASGKGKDNMDLELIPSARTFVPVNIPGSTQAKMKFENLQKSRERLEAWVKATGARVLTAETVWLRSSALEDIRKTSESSATSASGNRYRWLSAVRLYLDKEYPDPPAIMLPAMPKSGGLCSIA